MLPHAGNGWVMSKQVVSGGHKTSMAPGRSRFVVRLGVLGLFGALVLASCGGSSSSSSTTSTSSAPTDRAGDWTFLVYMAADNNLEPAALADLEQMTEADNTQFVVLVDRAPGYSDADLFGLGNFTDSAILHIQNGSVDVVGTPGEIDMGDPSTLSDFIDLGLKDFASKKNALVVWDHGGSWKGAAWDDSSVDPTDPQQSDHLTVAEMASGIRSGLRSAGSISRFDMLGFDACLMATYEVADALANYGDVLVSSEEVEPGHGWDWSAVSSPAKGSTDVQMADAILAGFADEAAQNDQTIVTLSAVDLRKMDALTSVLTKLASSLSTSAKGHIGRVGYGRNQALSFGKNPDPSLNYFSVDLGAFATELESVDGMESIAKSLHDVVHEVVIRHVAGPVTEEATGLAAYFPPAERFYSMEYDAAGLAPAWTKVLAAYYGTADSVTKSDLPEFTDDDRYLEPQNVLSDDDSIELLAKVTKGTGGNIIQGFMVWGLIEPDPNYVSMIGEMNAAVAGDTVSGAYTWRQLVLSDGVTSSVGFASLNMDSKQNLNRITIPILFGRGAESAEGSLELLLNGESITAETFYLQTDEGISAITPEPGDVFVPLVQRVRLSDLASEWSPATTTPLSALSAALTYTYSMVPTQTPMALGLTIMDVVGNIDLVMHVTTSPVKTD